MAAIRRSNCMIFGVDHPRFVFASKRPVAASRGNEVWTFVAAIKRVEAALHIAGLSSLIQPSLCSGSRQSGMVRRSIVRPIDGPAKGTRR